MSFVYGETDWMDPKAGVRVAASVQQSRGMLSSTDCQVSNHISPGCPTRATESREGCLMAEGCEVADTDSQTLADSHVRK